MDLASGSCLCGKVKFECENFFSEFHLCHCIQCQKTTGSAHASNLFTARENITWLSGQDYVRRFDFPGRSISKAFCTECGSPLPYLSGTGKALVVPAGSLDSNPNIGPQDNIFWLERASWYDEVRDAKHFEGFPE
jgi:hypothetical protein